MTVTAGFSLPQGRILTAGWISLRSPQKAHGLTSESSRTGLGRPAWLCFLSGSSGSGCACKGERCFNRARDGEKAAARAEPGLAAVLWSGRAQPQVVGDSCTESCRGRRAHASPQPPPNSDPLTLGEKTRHPYRLRARCSDRAHLRERVLFFPASATPSFGGKNAGNWGVRKPWWWPGGAGGVAWGRGA